MLMSLPSNIRHRDCLFMWAYVNMRIAFSHIAAESRNGMLVAVIFHWNVNVYTFLWHFSVFIIWMHCLNLFIFPGIESLHRIEMRMKYIMWIVGHGWWYLLIAASFNDHSSIELKCCWCQADDKWKGVKTIIVYGISNKHIAAIEQSSTFSTGHRAWENRKSLTLFVYANSFNT